MNWTAFAIGVVLLVFACPPLISPRIRRRHDAAALRRNTILNRILGFGPPSSMLARTGTLGWSVSGVVVGTGLVLGSVIAWLA